nr:conjugative transposon protein TraK [Mucilaginibacter paludis]
MKNIDSAFRQMRTFFVAVIAGYSLITGVVIYNSHQRASKAEQRVIVLANGKAIQAYESDRKDNIVVEAKDHVKTFHNAFFTFDPDEKVIQANVTKALYLADGSAKREYDNLKENGYYANIMSGNISQRIMVDSVAVDLNSYPYPFRCYATQSIIRTTSTIARSLVTEGFLRNVIRSDNNPHGFLIERWTTLENKDITTHNP